MASDPDSRQPPAYEPSIEELVLASDPEPTSTPNSIVAPASETHSHTSQDGTPHHHPHPHLHIPPGQQAHSPPPGGAYPQYSPYAPPQGYPLAPYQNPYGCQGYPVPGVPSYPGQYPPTNQYPPSPGQFPGQYGQYPPPTGAPPTGQYPTPPGQYPPTGQYLPPTGQYFPPTGQYPGFSPTGNYPFPGGPIAQTTSPGASADAYAPHRQASYYPPPQVANQPLWYLGTLIPDPHAPAAQHGVHKVPDYDPAMTYYSVVKAINSGHDSQLSDVLLPLDVFKMDALCDYAFAKTGKSLQELIHKSHHHGSFSAALCALTLGPLKYDVELAHKALAGLGTNETLLTELILGRPVHEIKLLIEGYKIKYGKDLVSEVMSDLSGKIERMFVMALNAQRPSDHLPVDHNQVAADIEALHHASKKHDEVAFFEILINRSNAHIAAVVTGFATRYKSLSRVIKKHFSGHLESSLLYLMHGAKAKRDGQGIWRDAKLIEKSMAGLGHRDTQLTYRLIRAHWNPHRLEAIKSAYKERYGKSLEARVKGETSGDYQKLLVAIIKSSENV